MCICIHVDIYTSKWPSFLVMLPKLELGLQASFEPLVCLFHPFKGL